MSKVKYTPHYINARNDRKIKKGRLQLGIEFYAIYWMLLEVLAEEADFKYPLADLDILADDFGTSIQKVQIVVLNYGLFNVDTDEKFFSITQVKALQPYLDKIEMYRLMGKKSGIARKKKALLQIEELEQLNEPKFNQGLTQVETEVEQLTNYTNKLTIQTLLTDLNKTNMDNKTFIEQVRKLYKPDTDKNIYPAIIETILDDEKGMLKVDLEGKLYFVTQTKRTIYLKANKSQKLWNWLYDQAKHGKLRDICTSKIEGKVK